jgi:uncharacterized protein YcbX
MRIGTVRELWRFPVKSMGGERVDSTVIGTRGLHGDRLWAVRDVEKNTLTTAKRIPRLLMLTAKFASEPAADVGPGSIPPVTITFPDGATASSTDADIDARLSAFLGKQVKLCALRDAKDKDFYKAAKSTNAEMREVFAVEDGEPMPDFSMMPLGKLAELSKYATPPGTFFDAMDLHVITTASLGTFDARRFRANIVVDTGDATGYLENEWSGGTLAMGMCVAMVDCPTPRCSMPTRAQPDLPADKAVLAAIARDADRCLGASATVKRAGTVRVGDDVSLEMPATTALGDWARARATGLKRMLIRAMTK